MSRLAVPQVAFAVVFFIAWVAVSVRGRFHWWRIEREARKNREAK